MIRLEGIGKTFGKGTAAEVVALKGIDLDFRRGEFTVLLGSNGSGKSTLLNVIAGAITADTGRIMLDGTDVTKVAEHRRSHWISRIFQDPLKGTAPELTLLENLRLASLRTSRKGLTIGTGAAFRMNALNRLASLGIGLENKLDQQVGTLSGGQRQALSLLMAVMTDAKILLLDEPTAALDPRTATTVMELANRLIREYGLTALLITHQLKDAVTYGERVIVLSEGTIATEFTGESRKSLQVSDLLKWFGA